MSLAAVIATLGVLALLGFAAAELGERTRLGQALAAHPVVGALALGIYCTSWTFYGSIGRASKSGLSFVAVYLGPTLLFLLGSRVQHRVIGLRLRLRLTSIADLASARYGKSQPVAALVTAILAVGLVPYLAVQMKAILGSVAALTGEGLDAWSGLAVVLSLALLTSLVGIRRVDPTERHPGLVLGVAASSLVKLAALSCALVAIAGWAFGSWDGLVEGIDRLGAAQPTLGPSSVRDVATFATTILLSASAFVLLPRQFHMGIVEAREPKQARTTRWLVPLFLLLMTVPTVPIALAANVLLPPDAPADLALLLIPMRQGSTALALLVFAGGILSAVGMVMVESIALSTMISNHLLMPVAQQVAAFAPVRSKMREVRWAAATALVFAGWQFAVHFSGQLGLVDIGILSFAATLALAPVVVGGLFWRGATRGGAIAGLVTGFGLWGYTALLPAIVRSGFFPTPILDDGPFGLAWLRPEALFGLSGLPPLTHTTFVTLLLGGAAWVFGSALFPASSEERQLSLAFLDDGPTVLSLESSFLPSVDRSAVQDVVAQYFPSEQVAQVVDRVFASARISGDAPASPLSRVELVDALEHELAGSIGSAGAHRAVKPLGRPTRQELVHVEREYARELGELGLSPRRLREHIDFHKERESLLEEQAQVLATEVRERELEIAERRRVEAELAAERARLEERVRERTAELEAARDAAQAGLQSKSAFIATMSHEIRTPMNGVLGTLALIQDSSLAPEQRDLVATAMSSAEVLLRILNDILDLSRIEAGKLSLERTPFSVQTCCRAVITLFEAQARDKGLALDLCADPGLPPFVLGDSLRVRQVLTNLVSNAVKFTPEGSISVKAASVDGRVRFEVTDTGLGVSPEKQARLFEKFVQGDASTTRRYGGTGLGLAISHELVALMGGRLSFAPRNPGSCFAFDLPLEAAPSPSPRSAPVDYRFDGVRALVVDDNAVNRLVAKQFLERMGCTVAEAIDGHEAVAACRTRPFDVVLMDCHMPGLDGFAAATEIRGMEDSLGGGHTPIIAVTASAQESDRLRCLGAGMDDLLPKPLSRRDLGRMLRRLVSDESTPTPRIGGPPT